MVSDECHIEFRNLIVIPYFYMEYIQTKNVSIVGIQFFLNLYCFICGIFVI